MKEWIKKHSISLIFILFFIFLLIQHSFVFLYHDDYGYSSLSYAYNVEDAIGHNVSLKQIAEFLEGHYKIWGGRILYFGIEIILLSKNIAYFRIIQSIILTGIFYFIYKIIEKNSKVEYKILLAILAIAEYGFFEISTINLGIFWFTASVLYVFPVFTLLFFICYYNHKKVFNHKYKKILYYIIMAILIFMSTFSQEQVSIAALSFIFIYTIYYRIKERTFNKLNFVMLFVGIMGFAILMLAPGNRIRTQDVTSIDFYSKPFFERIITGLQNVILNNFYFENRIFNFMFYSSVFYSIYCNIKNKKGVSILNYFAMLSTLMIVLFSITKTEGYFNYIIYLMNLNIYRIFVTFVFALQLALMIYSVFVFLFYKEQIKEINILISAIFSILCMVVAPYFPTRSSIVFQILVFTYILFCFNDSISMIQDKKSVCFIFMPIIIISILNVSIITKGYYDNSFANSENDNILIEASENIEEGNQIEAIKLKKLPNIIFSGVQPYIEGAEYILYWMREYYNIPNNIEIIYE